MSESTTQRREEKRRFTEFRNKFLDAKEGLAEALSRTKRNLEKVHPLASGITIMAGASLLGYALMQNPVTSVGTLGSGIVFNIGVLDFTTIAKTQPQIFVQQAGQILSKAFLGY